MTGFSVLIIDHLRLPGPLIQLLNFQEYCEPVEISHSGRIYTTEIGICYKLELP